MTREERNTKLKHFITCLKCEESGKECDANCSVQYEAGNMGEIIENLEAISKALEQEPCEDAIGRSDMLDAIGHGTTYTSEELQRIIKGLPSVNPQPCEDAISRQSVLESIKNLYPDMPVVDIMGSRRKWSARYAPYFECENAVEHLPPVNPKVKTGHWTIKENGHVKCSRCLVVQPYSSIFCPNCGARMIEPQESEG